MDWRRFSRVRLLDSPSAPPDSHLSFRRLSDRDIENSAGRRSRDGVSIVETPFETRLHDTSFSFPVGAPPPSHTHMHTSSGTKDHQRNGCVRILSGRLWPLSQESSSEVHVVVVFSPE